MKGCKVTEYKVNFHGQFQNIISSFDGKSEKILEHSDWV